MNTREIEKALKELALKLKHGNDREQQFGKDLVAKAVEIETYRKETQDGPLDERFINDNPHLRQPRRF